MPNEARVSQQGRDVGQFRRWGKKKSTDSPVAEKETPKAETPKAVAPSQETQAPSIPLPTEPEPVAKSLAEPPPSPMITPSSNGNKQTPSLFRKREAPKTEEMVLAEVKREIAFDQAALEEAWKAFAVSRDAKNSRDAEKLVLGRKLQKMDGSEVQIVLDSQLEMSILEKVEQDIVQFLRGALENDYVFLTKTVQAHTETQMLYTSKDKYAYMVEQNPALKELKDRLGLDFEY